MSLNGWHGAESKNDQRRERTRDQILEATRLVLIREGFEKITTRDIAKEAGVNIATLHYYFDNKETLLSEAVQYAVDRTLRQLRAVIQEAPDAFTALERAVQATWEVVKQRPGVLRYDLVVRGMRNAEAHRQATVVYDALHGIVREILDRHIGPDRSLASGVDRLVLERYLVAAVDGAILQYLVFGDEEKTEGCLLLILQHARSLLAGDGQFGASTQERTNL